MLIASLITILFHLVAFHSFADAKASFYGNFDTAVSAAAKRDNTIILITTNFGMWEFAANAYCSLHSLNRSSQTVVFALDRKAKFQLRQNGIPAYTDYKLRPSGSPLSVESTIFRADPFLRLTCGKLWISLHVLLMGINVLFVDADIFVVKDPLFELPLNDITFSDARRVVPKQDCVGKSWSDNVPKCEINTGFYFARASPHTTEFMSRANETCFRHTKAEIVVVKKTKHHGREFEWFNDQSITQHLVDKDSLAMKNYSLGCYNACKYVNTRVLLVYKLPQQYGIDPLLFHACFLVDKSEKMKTLRSLNMWNPFCLAKNANVSNPF